MNPASVFYELFAPLICPLRGGNLSAVARGLKLHTSELPQLRGRQRFAPPVIQKGVWGQGQTG